jgi:hypothetical protein
VTRRTERLRNAAAFVALVLIFSGASAGSCDVPPPPVNIPASPAPSGVPSSSPQPEPGSACTSAQVGDMFATDGTVYVCKEPRPYKWRPVRQ